jgi:hypothetical protein
MVEAMMLAASVLVSGVPRIDVLVLNNADVPAPIVAGARTAAQTIFTSAGIEIHWADAQFVRAQCQSLKTVYSIRIVNSATPHVAGDTLGFAFTETRVASVLYPAVDDFARAGRADVRRILGAVMAHELGHLLMGTTVHSLRGVMQATFDLTLAEQGLLEFTPDEASAMRSRLNSPARPSWRVRSAEPRLAALIDAGVAQSITFHRLVDTLNNSDVIVYVGPKHKHDALGGFLSHRVVIAGPNRYLQIAVSTFGSDRWILSVLAHELQHAVEVAEHPEARDVQTTAAMFDRIGIRGCAESDCWETQAAQDVQFAVNEELGAIRAMTAVTH